MTPVLPIVPCRAHDGPLLGGGLTGTRQQKDLYQRAHEACVVVWWTGGALPHELSQSVARLVRLVGWSGRPGADGCSITLRAVLTWMLY